MLQTELDYEFATVCRNDFSGTLSNGFTAHPKFDPADGQMHAICYAWQDLFDHVEYVVVDTDRLSLWGDLLSRPCGAGRRGPTSRRLHSRLTRADTASRLAPSTQPIGVLSSRAPAQRATSCRRWAC